MNLICRGYDHIVAKIEKLDWLPLLLFRIALGTVFILSGWGKLHNIEKVVGFFTDLGIPFPNFQAHMVAATELGGGILILLGLFTRLAAIPLSVTMIVAIITAKISEIHSFGDLMGTEEYLYFLGFFMLIIFGGGCASLDYLIAKKQKAYPASKN
jgi:putative oxidoreductase